MDPITDILVRRFGIAPADLRPHETQGNSSAAYRVARSGTDHLLRIHPSEEDAAALEYRMGLLEKLSRLGAPVVEPIRSPAGALVEVSGTRAATLLAIAPGRTHERLQCGSLPESLFHSLGKAIAELHRCAAGLPAKSAPEAWHEGDNCYNAPEAGSFPDREVAHRYDRLRAECLGRIPHGDEWWIIHGDLHFSNILLDPASGRVTFCDFDDACLGFRDMDLAMVLFDLDVILEGPTRGQDFPRLAGRILEGYREGSDGLVPTRMGIDPFVRLLEASLYIQYHAYFTSLGEPDPEDWLTRFFAGRRERILSED
ncbi:MAG: phosphotransferase [Clostridia bacterium]|nr:phosphotransferase [Clostridia bacterium]